MFTYHDKETALVESKTLMEQSEAGFGFVPNLHKILAEAPASYEAYMTAFNLFMGKTTLSPLEVQVVFMTASYENRCHYCIAGHTWGMKNAKMPDNVIESLREGKPIDDQKLEALRKFTGDLIEKRGQIGDSSLQHFIDAGYNQRQALEVLCGLSAKLISNFTNALAKTKLDPPMEPYAWKHPEVR